MKPKLKTSKRRNIIKVSVPLDVFPTETVMRAAYVFTDRYHVSFGKPDRGGFNVEFRLKDGCRPAAGDLAGELGNECLAQALRMKISEKTAAVRNLIVETALRGAVAVPAPPPPAACEDYRADPLGIAITWEEKYGKKKSKK